MIEMFKPSRFPEYEVSNLGRVKRVVGGRGVRIGHCLSPHKTSNGYLNVRLTTNGQKKIPSIHGLVAEAFLGPRPQGLQVRHLDGDKTNNSIHNLAYGTPKENGQDNVRLGVMPKGERVHSSVLTQDQAAKCIELLQKKMSATQVARLLKIPKNTVYKIKYNRTWKWLAEGKATI